MTGVLPLKRVAQVLAGQSPPSSEVKDLSQGLPFLQGNAEFGSEFPAARYECQSPPKCARAGDVLLSVRAPVGALNIADQPYGIGRGLASIRARDAHFRFIWWWLHSQRSALDAVSTGTTYSAVTAEDIEQLKFPQFTLDEQRRIADFLDIEATRIDHLDGLATSACRVLAERRHVLLERVIMTDNVPLQKLFRRLRLLRDGTHQPPPRTSTGVPLLTARNVSSGFLKLTDQDTFVSTDDAAILEASLRLEYRDILLSVKGTVGAAAIVPPEFQRVVLDRNLALLRPNQSLLNEWLLWVLRTQNLQEQMSLSVTAAAQPGLPLGAIRELRIPSIDIEEQKEQVRKIEAQEQELVDLESKIQSQRYLLAERRQALITAAVTGHIDVTTVTGLVATGDTAT
ncbi:MAG: restriction endonuclease subunit S [Actinomycetota bacterium]|nr:restriction endonuclease subunit S [Actinomycetota bacterium]